MLKIKFNVPDNETFGHPNRRFPFRYEDSWFDDPIVRQIVKDIENGEVISANAIKVEPYGVINCTQLSSTCRNLILAYELDDVLINATYCGDSAGAWLMRLGDMKDVSISLNYPLDFPEGIRALILNDNSKVTCRRDYLLAARKFL